MSERDWASQLAYSITHACCVDSKIIEDLIASELRRIEATGYSRGYEAAQNDSRKTSTSGVLIMER